MVEVRDIGLGVREIRPKVHGDERGSFCETWNAEALRDVGIDINFVQDNHSISARKGVLRGLHFQAAPKAQAKLVRVSRGSIFDVAVDIRPDSATFGQWVGLRLSAADWNQLLVPEGFAHGFVTLEPDCEVQYKVSAPYSAAHDRGIAWNDPDIAVDWPVEPAEVALSDKDRLAPSLAELQARGGL